MLEVTEKKCGKCKKTKPPQDFTFDKNTRDGLRWECKECTRAYQLALKQKEKNSPEEKRCRACGVVKLRRYFYTTNYRPDGLRDWCIDCEKKFQQSKKEKRNERAAIQPEFRVGIDTWDQVGGVLREIAELQLRAKIEAVNCKEHITLIKKDSEEAVAPIVNQQIFLRLLLESFLRKACSTSVKTFRKYRFGGLHYYRGNLRLDLNLELAHQRAGQP